MLVSRDMEDGYQSVRAEFPLVILASTGLDEPRVPSVKGIMGAKRNGRWVTKDEAVEEMARLVREGWRVR